MVDITEINRIIQSWNIPAFRPGYKPALQVFSEQINSWLNVIPKWNISQEDASNPDAAFFLNLQSVCGVNRLPDFESGMSQEDFQKNIKQVCEIFGASEFQDIEKTVSYKRFFEESFVPERLEQTAPLPEIKYAMIHEEAFTFWPDNTDTPVDTSHMKEVKNALEAWTKEHEPAWRFSETDLDKCPQLVVWLYFHYAYPSITLQQAETYAHQNPFQAELLIHSLRRQQRLCPLAFEFSGQGALEEYLRYSEVEKRVTARDAVEKQAEQKQTD